jgi:DNA-binding NtrC family response regulator/pSer/pThr/pTyr-binding forkhead associated (FHA) protein
MDDLQDPRVGSGLPLDTTLEKERHQAAAPKAPVTLIVFHGAAAHFVGLTEGKSVVVGRDPAADLCVSDQSLSRRHARFVLADGSVFVEDLGSTNRTLLNGDAVERLEAMEPGDEVTMGDIVAAIHVRAPLAERPVGDHDRFLDALEAEVERCRTFGRSAALLMLRDAAPATHRAAALRQSLRSVDSLALYSAETLEVLLPETDAEGARSIAERLGLPAGLAICPESGTSAGALIDACCEALRQASTAAPIQIARSQRQRWARDAAPPAIPERSAAMSQLYDTVQRLSSSQIPVLILGETGTGKEVLARAIHDSSPRRGARMACINCGAIPATLVESILFGHERGAFTGATQSSKGMFEEASGGTVLLDEVGELSPAAQAALLRVLETKRISRVGSTKEIPADVRVIAATHRDLEAMAREERFRADLYYRLNAMTLRLPPLRERVEEIGPLAEVFIEQANQANGRAVRGTEPQALRLLHQYSWPGNVRELRNAIERAVVIARGDQITVDDLPEGVRTASSARPPLIPTPTVEGEELDLRDLLQRYETQLIMTALERAKGDRNVASQLLKIPLRTLSHRIQRLGIRKGYGVGED